MKYILVCIFSLLNLLAIGQYKMSRQEYIVKYKDIAIEQMKTYRIPASITLAQGILESGSGGSRLAVQANNHFGIKCGTGWSGSSLAHDDDAKGECFRSYNSPIESYIDHSIFLSTKSRYAPLFKLQITDYQGWAHGLKAAGYATAPHYGTALVQIIEANNLQQFDIIDSYKQGENRADRRPVVAQSVRQHGVRNRVKYVIAKESDSFLGIALDNKISLGKLLKYNDLSQSIALKSGVAVYVQNKKSKSESEKYHTVKKGETTHLISQKYAIKMRSLVKKNPILNHRAPEVGEQLRLR